MTVLYKSYQSTRANKAQQKLYHPRVVLVGNVGTDQIAREIAAYSSLSSGDVKNVIDNLVTVMTQHLQASQSVTLEGLGSFRLTMNSAGRGVATAEEVNAAQAKLMVRFLPASRQNPDGTTATRSLVTGAKCKRFDRADDGSLPEEPLEPDAGDDSGEDGGL